MKPRSMNRSDLLSHTRAEAVKRKKQIASIFHKREQVLLICCCAVAFPLWTSANTTKAQPAPQPSASVAQPLVGALMLQAVMAIQDHNMEDLLITTRESLVRMVGMSSAAFSWRDSRRVPQLGLSRSFPAVPESTESKNESAIDSLISSTIRAQSLGTLPTVDPEGLGYIPNFSAATFDQILFMATRRGHVGEFQDRSTARPPSVQSIKQYAMEGIRIVLICGLFKNEDVGVQKIAANLMHDKSKAWRAVASPSVFSFSSVPQQIVFSPNLAHVDENGRLANRIYEMARLSVGASTSFAIVAQLNYYSPGCCWDFSSAPPLRVNAYLLAYNELNGIEIYAGYGLAGRESGVR